MVGPWGAFPKFAKYPKSKLYKECHGAREPCDFRAVFESLNGLRNAEMVAQQGPPALGVLGEVPRPGAAGGAAFQARIIQDSTHTQDIAGPP